MLFLDSLKMHNKNEVKKTLLKWLNVEWAARDKGGDRPETFQNDSMFLVVPKSKCQELVSLFSWDAC